MIGHFLNQLSIFENKQVWIVALAVQSSYEFQKHDFRSGTAEKRRKEKNDLFTVVLLHLLGTRVANELTHKDSNILHLRRKPTG